jgi:hypothetical protein
VVLFGNGFLPSFEVELAGFAIYFSEFFLFVVNVVAQELATYNRTLQSDNTDIVACGSLHYDHIAGFQQLTRCVFVDSFAGILKPYFI